MAVAEVLSLRICQSQHSRGNHEKYLTGFVEVYESYVQLRMLGIQCLGAVQGSDSLQELL